MAPFILIAAAVAAAASRGRARRVLLETGGCYVFALEASYTKAHWPDSSTRAQLQSHVDAYAARLAAVDVTVTGFDLIQVPGGRLRLVIRGAMLWDMPSREVTIGETLMTLKAPRGRSNATIMATELAPCPPAPPPRPPLPEV